MMNGTIFSSELLSSNFVSTKLILHSMHAAGRSFVTRLELRGQVHNVDLTYCYILAKIISKPCLLLVIKL